MANGGFTIANLNTYNVSTASASGTRQFNGNEFLQIALNGGPNVTFDAIRFATTLETVVIPEPSALAPLGLGLAALVIQRRRRK
ncbi:MAG: PEP-CTERM sorting domain-containing protein [Verrucomicrobiales bacterium]